MKKLPKFTPLVKKNGTMSGGFIVLSENNLSKVRGGDRNNDVCHGNATCNNNGVCVGNGGRCVGNGVCDSTVIVEETR